MTFHVAYNLRDLIDFKDDGMNKIVLAENDNSLVLLVALKKEQVMPEHVSPVDAFIYVLEGELTFTVYENEESPSEYKVKKDETFFFKKEERHFLTANKDTKILVVRT